MFSLYDLAVEPEIVQDLRKEITKVLECNDGLVTAKSMFEMKLLDVRRNFPFENMFFAHILWHFES